MARAYARDCAARLLYARALGGDPIDDKSDILKAGLAEGEEAPGLDGGDKAYIAAMLDGVGETLDELDDWVEQYAVGWALERISKVDLSVLRLALFEMLHREDIPVNVSISEAVGLCNRFSTPESAAFVNGILGSVSRRLEEQ
ncbi:MAG: transcription antitermination factor NusB [Christensenellaceae bacterium]|jgi:N utilization substance protein B|nr:transcription antitermination factor NusB [Christensenellaceae bacterium]